MHFSINWLDFTPGASLIGGMLIGLAASILVIFRGKVAGISGIVAGLMETGSPSQGHHRWRVMFLIGLVGSSFVYELFAPLPEINIAEVAVAGNALFSQLDIATLCGKGGQGETEGIGAVLIDNGQRINDVPF